LTWKPQPSPAPTDISALRKEIRAEREARIESKIAAGKAVRRPPTVVGIADPKRDYFAVHKDVDGIEHYPQGLVITGVPRSGRDDDLPIPTSSPPSWAVETKPVERKAPPLPQPARVELPTEGPRHSIRCTVRPPDEDKNDPGQIIQGAYSLSGSVLRVYDADDRLIGTDKLKPGDDAVHAARKVLKEKHGRHGSFHDPISYAKRSYH
jgi:hypothetical protein